MPTYIYENTLTGERIERNVPVAKRDDQPWPLKRIEVPPRVGFITKAIDPGCADASVPRAFREYELTAGASKIVKETGFSVDHIRKTWAFGLALLLAVSALAGDITTGHTYTDGDTLTASGLNSIVNDAVIGPSFFTNRTAIGALGTNDSFLIWSATGNAYRKLLAGSLSTNIVREYSQTLTGTNWNLHIAYASHSFAACPSLERWVLVNNSDTNYSTGNEIDVSTIFLNPTNPTPAFALAAQTSASFIFWGTNTEGTVQVFYGQAGPTAPHIGRLVMTNFTLKYYGVSFP